MQVVWFFLGGCGDDRLLQMVNLVLNVALSSRSYKCSQTFSCGCENGLVRVTIKGNEY